MTDQTLEAQPHRRRRMAPMALERFVDLACTLPALLFLLPLFVAIAVLVRAADGGPAFYAQRRIGRGGRMFDCLKFRTMASDSQTRLRDLLNNDPNARLEWERDHKLTNDPRVTPIGQFLRATSLDELPQLINIVRGEMTLVGPRPIVETEIRRYGHYFNHYCSGRPGLTGLWQVSGRSDVSYRRRVAMDVLYVRRKNLRLNLQIIIATIPAVLLRRGAY